MRRKPTGEPRRRLPGRTWGAVCLGFLTPLVGVGGALSSAPSPTGASTVFQQGAMPTSSNPSGCTDLQTFASNTHTDTTGTFTYAQLDYLQGGAGWDAMDGKEDHLSSLATWAGCTVDGNLVTPVIAVPIIPTVAKVPQGSLQDGATDFSNQYQARFQTLATNLVADGLTNAVLRLGWEFDNHAYAWTTDKKVQIGLSEVWEPDPQMAQWYAEYFRNIVTDMRSTENTLCSYTPPATNPCPNGLFTFAWNPDGYAFLGSTGNTSDPSDPAFDAFAKDENQNEYYDIADAWPNDGDGKSYVDYIGMDLYDQRGWNSYPTSNTPPNDFYDYIRPQLNNAEAFSSQNGAVSLAFPEWGVCKNEGTSSPATDTCPVDPNEDDPSYIVSMYNFMANPASLQASNTVPVAWENYFNVAETGWNSDITAVNGVFPSSLQCFEKYFGKDSGTTCAL